MTVKRLGLLFALLVAVVSSRADLLYWQLEQDPSDSSSVLFNYAVIKDSDSGQILTLKSEDGVAQAAFASKDGLSDGYSTYYVEGKGGYWAELPSAYGSKSGFLVELYDSAGNPVGYTDSVFASVLADAKAIGKSGESLPSTPFSGWTVHAVPEPTSGLLTLLGIAALALRRRKSIWATVR